MKMIEHSKVLKTKNDKTMLSSKCAICGCSNSRFMKEKGLLSSLGIKPSVSNIPLLDKILFSSRYQYKMNEIVNKFLLGGDRFMPKMHLKQLGFTCSACGPLTKSKERIQKSMQTVNANYYIYKNDLDKSCFQHDMTYGKYKDFTKRTQSDRVLKNKAFEISSNKKYGGYDG